VEENTAGSVIEFANWLWKLFENPDEYEDERELGNAVLIIRAYEPMLFA
jgi:hypothetical protein